MIILKESEQFNLENLNNLAKKTFGNLVKVVVDVERNIIALDMEMHADAESELLQAGSQQNNLWGINLYPDLYNTNNFIEFDSMINIRPSQNNRSRDVDDEATRQKIIKIISKIITN